MPARPYGFMGGPFNESEFQPLPAGWSAGPPHFVGVGVPKAGTSWWYSLLIQHPLVAPHRLFDVSRPLETKELHYFVHFGWRSPDDSAVRLYRNAFAAPPHGISGEWSVLYLSHPASVTHLARAVSDVRVLVMLRDPITRLASHLNHLVRNRKRALRISEDQSAFFEVFSANPEAVLHSLYGAALARLFALFPRDRVLVLQYERCREAPARELARTFRFLGVDDSFVPSDLSTPVNQQDYVIEKPTAAERENLAQYFATDVRLAASLCPELDLSYWPDFERVAATASV